MCKSLQRVQGRKDSPNQDKKFSPCLFPQSLLVSYISTVEEVGFSPLSGEKKQEGKKQGRNCYTFYAIGQSNQRRENLKKGQFSLLPCPSVTTWLSCDRDS